MVVPVDEAGRNDDQIRCMNENSRHITAPPRLKNVDALYAKRVADEQHEFPKVLFHAAYSKRKDGSLVFKGDLVSPKYPMPADLAREAGVIGKVTGATRDSSGYILGKHPYETFSCVVYDAGNRVNMAQSKQLEAEMLKKGWVAKLSDLDLPKPAFDED